MFENLDPLDFENFENTKENGYFKETTKINDKILIVLKTTTIENLYSIFQGLKMNQTVTFISLYSLYLGKEGARILSESIEKNNTLRSFDLRQNRFGDKGIEIICNSLKNKKLKTLRIDSNEFHELGMICVSNTFLNHPTLENLSVNFNTCEPNTFCGLVLNNKKINHLSLENTNMVILKELKTNTSLTSLSMNGNSFGDYNLKILCESLKTNNSLKKLNIQRNGLSAFDPLLDSLKLNQSLIEMKIRDNKSYDPRDNSISDQFAFEIDFLLSANRCWDIKSHSTLPALIKQIIFTFFCSLHFKSKSMQIKIPKNLIYVMVRFIDRKSYFRYVESIKTQKMYF